MSARVLDIYWRGHMYMYMYGICGDVVLLIFLFKCPVTVKMKGALYVQ